MELYKLLSPYLYITYTALFTGIVTHFLFLKQYLKDKKADRNNQIYQQRDLLNKEIFDLFQLKVEEIYESLGWVRAYHKLLPDSYSDPRLFEVYSKTFYDRCSLLVDRLFSLSLLLEKYDFIIDANHSLSQICMDLHVELGKINFDITRISLGINRKDIKQSKNLNELCKNLLEISKKINSHTKKISEESKKILKNVFDSLDRRIEK
ncbi:MAG: hypothetical protein KR126chlam5_01293 [Candidatus Anoxychlamydiales bacterium]|nr:hypothetical protein [Candidatus Anoxychlamydiales bacterium]